MRLHYDHYYTKGVTHEVCEDYAVQGDTPTPFIILSDGCSSSERSDIGAQILTLTAQQMMKKKWPLDYLDFGQQLIDTGWKVVEKMQLPSQVLDATIMLAFLHEDNIMVYVYGDGCLLFKDQAGKLGTIEIAFTHNAPYFLTYWHDEERRHEYAKEDAKPLLIIDSVNGQSEPQPFKTQLIFAFPLKKFKMVAIASDGATHCVDRQQGLMLPLFDVATQLLAFQDLSDDFVKRHTESVLAQRGIYPADDLSIGVFVQ